MRKKEVWLIVANKGNHNDIKMRILCKNWKEAQKILPELQAEYPLDLVYAVECK